ncbi:MAG: hypothetical protein M3R69_14275 [Acidobacteriota bacterium]|nr:hypothetical protein [Acidobacteriota bacterium]
MKQFLGMIKPRKSLLIASVLALMCFGVLIGGVRSSRRHGVESARLSRFQNDIKIINNTTTLDASFQITGNNHLLIRLTNISSKGLNGYVVAVNGGRITADISSGDQVVYPGQTTELEQPIRSSTMTVNVLAAMFADGSIEAEPILKTELTEWRVGLKKELARGLAAMEEVLESPDVYTTETLDRLDSQLTPLHSDKIHSHSELGTENARDSFKSAIQSLRERQQREGPFMQRQRLLDLKARLERRIASL